MTWIDRIERAKRVGFFDPNDKELVASWSSCAVGERFKWGMDARMFVDMDRYDKARELGSEFNIVVCVNDITEAERLYNEIQAFADTVSRPCMI